jgi:general secretion pathway protein B
VSFILDALRKSETERQRQAGPGLVDAGYRPPAQRRALWLPLLLVVLTANLALMGWYFLRPAPPGEAPPPAAGTPGAAPGADPPAVATSAPTPAAAGRSLADAAGVAAPEDGPYDATADLPALDPAAPVTEVLEVPPQAGDASAPAATTAPGGSATPASGGIADSLPTATQLMEAGAIPVRPLHLDIHVWSDLPAERFVFVNMRKYGEGSLLPDGARIEEITPDGVVLSQDGQRFVLNRD